MAVGGVLPSSSFASGASVALQMLPSSAPRLNKKSPPPRSPPARSTCRSLVRLCWPKSKSAAEYDISAKGGVMYEPPKSAAIDDISAKGGVMYDPPRSAAYDDISAKGGVMWVPPSERKHGTHANACQPGSPADSSVSEKGGVMWEPAKAGADAALNVGCRGATDSRGSISTSSSLGNSTHGGSSYTTGGLLVGTVQWGRDDGNSPGVRGMKPEELSSRLADLARVPSASRLAELHARAGPSPSHSRENSAHGGRSYEVARFAPLDETAEMGEQARA